jgi:hypothetical protein
VGAKAANILQATAAFALWGVLGVSLAANLSGLPAGASVGAILIAAAIGLAAGRGGRWFDRTFGLSVPLLAGLVFAGVFWIASFPVAKAVTASTWQARVASPGGAVTLLIWLAASARLAGRFAGAESSGVRAIPAPFAVALAAAVLLAAGSILGTQWTYISAAMKGPDIDHLFLLIVLNGALLAPPVLSLVPAPGEKAAGISTRILPAACAAVLLAAGGAGLARYAVFQWDVAALPPDCGADVHGNITGLLARNAAVRSSSVESMVLAKGVECASGRGFWDLARGWNRKLIEQDPFDTRHRIRDLRFDFLSGRRREAFIKLLRVDWGALDGASRKELSFFFEDWNRELRELRASGRFERVYSENTDFRYLFQYLEYAEEAAVRKVLSAAGRVAIRDDAFRDTGCALGPGEACFTYVWLPFGWITVSFLADAEVVVEAKGGGASCTATARAGGRSECALDNRGGFQRLELSRPAAGGPAGRARVTSVGISPGWGSGPAAAEAAVK